MIELFLNYFEKLVQNFRNLEELDRNLYNFEKLGKAKGCATNKEHIQVSFMCITFVMRQYDFVRKQRNSRVIVVVVKCEIR